MGRSRVLYLSTHEMPLFFPPARVTEGSAARMDNIPSTSRLSPRDGSDTFREGDDHAVVPRITDFRA